MIQRERFEVLYRAELERQGKTFDPVVFRLEASGDYFIGLVQAAWWGYQQAVPVAVALPVKAPFNTLSYGAKFKYGPDDTHDRVYVKLGHDLVANWDERLVASSWVGQGLYSFADDESKLSDEVYLVSDSACKSAGVAPVVDRSAVRAAVAIALSDAYDCTRVWAAWGVGTMSEDDFQLVAEDDERLDEIVEAALVAAGLAVPS